MRNHHSFAIDSHEMDAALREWGAAFDALSQAGTLAECRRLLVGMVMNRGNLTVDNRLNVRQNICKGHAYDKHFRTGEFKAVGVKDYFDFVDLVADTIAEPTQWQKPDNDRVAFWRRDTRVLVIYNPNDPKRKMTTIAR